MKSYEKNVSIDSNYFNYVASKQCKEKLLYVLCTGIFVYKPGYYLSRKSFDSYLVELILEGSMTFQFGDETITAHAGDVILIDCYKPHKYYTDIPCKTIWAHFDGRSAQLYYEYVINANGNVFTPGFYQAKDILSNLNDIYEVFSGYFSANIELIIANKLTNILTAMSANSDPDFASSNNISRINTVAKYINEHLSEPLFVEDLAKMALFSKYHFIRIFSSVLGLTPRQYIIKTRMDYAKYLLSTTSISIQEIAYNVGYSSESTFCSSFKKYYGTSPTSFRTAKTTT